MKLSVLQPAYFPALDFWVQLLASDVVVLADTFKYSKTSNINRTRIKTISNDAWLTVPILSKGEHSTLIKNTQIDNHENWRFKHWKSFEINYKNSPFFLLLCDELEKFYQKNYSDFFHLCIDSITLILNILRIDRKKILASECPVVKDRTERVLRWLNHCNCDTYMIYKHHLHLIEPTKLKNHTCTSFTIEPVPYHQQYQNFSPNLSILDLLFNEGEMSIPILQKSFSSN